MRVRQLIPRDQEEKKVKERYYFFVADRKKQKAVTLLDILEPQQQTAMNGIVQQAYQKWLKQQKAEVRQKERQRNCSGDRRTWFFIQEGLIGLHYRPMKLWRMVPSWIFI